MGGVDLSQDLKERCYRYTIATLMRCREDHIRFDEGENRIVIETGYCKLYLPTEPQMSFRLVYVFGDLEQMIFEAMPRSYISQRLGVDIHYQSGSMLCFNSIPNPEAFWKNASSLHAEVLKLANEFRKEWVAEKISAWMVTKGIKGERT